MKIPSCRRSSTSWTCLASSLLTCCFGFSYAYGQCAALPSDLWALTYADEFNGPTLSTDWTAENGRWPYNEEWETYRPYANTTSNGNLVITATYDPRVNPPYVSGRINTRNRFLQQYGKFEMRAKMPRGRGIWPAFWLLPQDSWPPEIDIMEFLGHDVSTVYFTNHWGVYPNVASQNFPYSGPDFSAAYHTFACEWWPGQIDYFVDGVRRASARNPGVPDVPMYVILNVAVGGLWPGYPDATTVFPQQMLVDYVRVYAPVLPNQRLANPGFDGQSPLSGWVTSGNVFTESSTARSTPRSGKMYGNFTGAPNTSSAHQEVTAIPGDVMAGVGWFYNWQNDAMGGQNTASLVLEWRTSTNQVISRVSQLAANAATPRNLHTRILVQGTAPANAAKARLVVEFRQVNNAGGAIFFDDLMFGRIDCPVPCIADFNEDGGIDGADVAAFFVDWAASLAAADVNADGGIDGADVETFFVLWSSGSC